MNLAVIIKSTCWKVSVHTHMPSLPVSWVGQGLKLKSFSWAYGRRWWTCQIIYIQMCGLCMGESQARDFLWFLSAWIITPRVPGIGRVEIFACIHTNRNPKFKHLCCRRWGLIYRGCRCIRYYLPTAMMMGYYHHWCFATHQLVAVFRNRGERISWSSRAPRRFALDSFGYSKVMITATIQDTAK